MPAPLALPPFQPLSPLSVMMTVLDQVRQFVRRHGLFAPRTRAVVAVSGGSDSVALLHLMQALHAAGEVCLVAAAHFNHQLRDTAARDEALSAEAARALGIPYAVDRADVIARARLERRSIEAAARSARYDFLERVRRECAADIVALGHTRDDQA